jgi:soluble lytic murein transglycosylase-like protein
MGQLAGLLALEQSASEVARERAIALALPLSEAERRILPLALRAGAEFSVEPALILAVIWHETAHTFDPRSVNWNEPKGGPSVGLMQLQLPTARGVLGDPALPLEALYDPGTNVRAGTKYLAAQLRRYRWEYGAALAAYNAGTAYRRRAGGFVNQRYVDQVLGRLAVYRGGGLPAPLRRPLASTVAMAARTPWPWLGVAGLAGTVALVVARRRAVA